MFCAPPPIVEDAVAKRFVVDAAPLKLKLIPEIRPVLEMEKRVEVELVEVVEPIAKSVVRFDVDALWMEKSAYGDEVPTPVVPDMMRPLAGGVEPVSEAAYVPRDAPLFVFN